MSIILNGTTFANGGTALYNGTSLSSIKYGTTEVWRRSVTLTNLIGNSDSSTTHTIDIGYNSGITNYRTISTESGHRYYVRAKAECAGSFASSPTPTSRAQIGGTNIASIYSVNSTTNHAIITAGSSSVLRHFWQGTASGSGVYASCKATWYMLVDLTELESATGTTFTASSFWSYIGSSVFYGDKEVTP